MIDRGLVSDDFFVTDTVSSITLCRELILEKFSVDIRKHINMSGLQKKYLDGDQVCIVHDRDYHE